jgi:hypothetical protein
MKGIKIIPNMPEDLQWQLGSFLFRPKTETNLHVSVLSNTKMKGNTMKKKASVV